MSFDNNGGGAHHPLELVLAWGFVGIPLLVGHLRNSGQRDEALSIAPVLYGRERR